MWSHGATKPLDCGALVRELAHGLRTLNLCAQVVHGDLKPANLILTRKTSHLVMIDFGSAWMMEQTSTRVLGDGMSAAYAAPELQLGDGMVDDRVDQFSASVILYELLTLSLPYANLGGRAGRPENCGDKTLCLIPPSVRLRDPGALPIRIRNELDTVVSRGLSLHADDRYPTNGEWLVALDGLFRRMSDVAAPPSRTTIVQRAIQWFDRQRRGRSPRQDKGV